MMISQLSPVNKNIKSYLSSTYKYINNPSIENSQTQNNLTLTQSNAIKNSLLLNNINFKGKVLAPSFDIKDIKIIQELLSKCHYGKKDLIYEGDISQIRIKRSDFGFAIENFYTNDNRPDGKITGICEELTYKLGKRLEKLFGDKYMIFGIYGRYKEFGSHVYLGILKNTRESQKLVLEQSENYEKAKQLFKIRSSKQSGKKVSDINKKFIELMFDINNLKGCLIIDPSFSKVEELGVGGNMFEGYNSHFIRELDRVNAVPTTERPTLGLPLGYLKDIVPELANTNNENEMVTLVTSKQTWVLAGGNEINLDELGKEHPLVAFVIKLNNELTNYQ